jgi:hypothetical protein
MNSVLGTKLLKNSEVTFTVAQILKTHLYASLCHEVNYRITSVSSDAFFKVTLIFRFK